MSAVETTRPAFSPVPLRDATAAEQAGWQRALAARRAAHLRALAQRLGARGNDAAPLRCETALAPLFRSPQATPVTLPAALTLMNEADPTKLRGARRVRLGAHATRWRVQLDDGNVWVWGCSSLRTEGQRAYVALRGWAASCADLRFRLTARSTTALLDHAAQIEHAHDVSPQPALWLLAPTGWLKGVAWNLARAALCPSGKPLVEHAWNLERLELDLLDPEFPALPQSLKPLAARLAGSMQRAAARREVAWTQARLSITDKPPWCHPDDTWVHVELESASPFMRVDAWLNDAFDVWPALWVPPICWPTFGASMLGPGEPSRGWLAAG